MPHINPEAGWYLCGLPGSKEIYLGIFEHQYFGRRRLHTSQCITEGKDTMDQCHSKMLKFGVARFLFMCAGDREWELGQFTTLFWRLVEDRGMVLFPVTMNTQGQSLRGSVKVDVAY